MRVVDAEDAFAHSPPLLRHGELRHWVVKRTRRLGGVGEVEVAGLVRAGGHAHAAAYGAVLIDKNDTVRVLECRLQLRSFRAGRVFFMYGKPRCEFLLLLFILYLVD